MNNGIFQGMGVNSAAPAVSIGGIVQFPSTYPEELVFPDGSVYLRTGLNPQPLSRYGLSSSNYPKFMTSHLSVDSDTSPALDLNIWAFSPFLWQSSNSTAYIPAVAITSAVRMHRVTPSTGAIDNSSAPGAVVGAGYFYNTFHAVGSRILLASQTSQCELRILRSATDLADFQTNFSISVVVDDLNTSSTLNVNRGMCSFGNNVIFYRPQTSISPYWYSSNGGASWASASLTSVGLGTLSDSVSRQIINFNSDTGTILSARSTAQSGGAIEIRRSTGSLTSFTLVDLSAAGNPDFTRGQGVVVGLAYGNGRWLLLVQGSNGLGAGCYTSTDDGLSWRSVGNNRLPMPHPEETYSNSSLIYNYSENLRFFRGRFYYLTRVSYHSNTPRVYLVSSEDGEQWDVVSSSLDLQTSTPIAAPYANGWVLGAAGPYLSRAVYGSYTNTGQPTTADPSTSSALNYIRIK